MASEAQHEREKREEDKKVWDAIARHVSRGEQALELLEQAYLYSRDGKFHEETWRKIQAFFHYDRY